MPRGTKKLQVTGNHWRRKTFKPRPQNKILVPLFQNFCQALPFFLNSVTCPRANKYRVQWTAILTNRGGWKTNKKLLKSCQTSEYQYASVNCTQFWWVDSSSLFQAFNYLGRSAKRDARKKGAETRRGKSRKFVQSLFISPSFSISKVLVIPTASRKRIKHFFLCTRLLSFAI